jgi:PKHD-type hydroxylase
LAVDLLARPLLPRNAARPYHPFLVRQRVFTPAQCRRIVELGTSLPTDRAELHDDVRSGDVDRGVIRRSATAWIPPDEGSEWIYHRLAAVADRANQSYGFDLTGFEEDLQFTTYDRRGAHYTWHQDGLDGSVGHRKLSIVVQLSDPGDYDGAALEFLEVAEDYDRDQRRAFLERSSRQGAAIVFPSFEFHRVLPLRRGLRRSLVAWVGGPPFR